MLTESMLRLAHIVPSGAEGTLKILGLHVALLPTVTVIILYNMYHNKMTLSKRALVGQLQHNWEASSGNQLFHICIRRCTFKEVESFLSRMLGQYICIHTFIT